MQRFSVSGQHGLMLSLLPFRQVIGIGDAICRCFV
jgi:hypothetical protein